MTFSRAHNRFHWPVMALAVLVSLSFTALSAVQLSALMEASGSARGHSEQLVLAGEQCSESDIALTDCEGLSQYRRQLDLAVAELGRHRSLALLFAAFAIVVPGLIWAAYNLTRVVFRRDPANRQFDD